MGLALEFTTEGGCGGWRGAVLGWWRSPHQEDPDSKQDGMLELLEECECQCEFEECTPSRQSGLFPDLSHTLPPALLDLGSSAPS